MDKQAILLSIKDILIIFNQSVGVLSIITILRLISSSSTIIKNFGWFKQNKSIVAKQKTKNLITFWQVTYAFVIGSLEVYLPLLAFLWVATIIVFLYNVTFVMKHVFLIICILFLFPSLFMMKYKNRKRFLILFGIVSMILADVLVSLVIVTSLNETFVYSAIGILCVSNYLVIKYFLTCSEYYMKYCIRRFKWLKIVRVLWPTLFLVFLICNMAIRSNEYASAIIYIYGIVWLVLYYVECGIIWNEEKENLVTFKINMLNEVCETKEKIVQYREDKIKFTTDNKLERLVDSKEIQSIVYRSTTYFKKKTEKKVVCYLKNGKRLFANKYKYLTDNWVCFYVIRGDQYKATVIKANAIKEIVTKKYR